MSEIRVHDSGDGRRQVDVSVLAEMHEVVIGDIFPALALVDSEMIEPHLFDRRSLTSLRRRQCVTWGDLSVLTVRELWQIPSAGRMTVERLLSAAQARATEASARGNWWAPPVPGTAVSREPGVPVRGRNDGHTAIATFVSIFAEWAFDARDARTVGDLLAALDETLPEEVATMYSDVESLDVSDILIRGALTGQAGAIARFLDAIGSDARFVVERHVAAPSGRVPTLESLAERNGITRERVRQIVQRGIARAAQLRETSEFRLLRWRAEALSSSLGVACRSNSTDAVAAIERAAHGFDDPSDCSARDFMLWFAGEYREQDGWWLVGDAGRLDSVKRLVKEALRSEWLLERRRMVDALSEAGVASVVDDGDIASLSGWRSIGSGWWVRWDGTVGDKAERVFRLALRSLRPDEMNELIGDGHAASSVRNVLASDKRFARVSMELHYALAEWGWEEYSTTAQEIAERIERAGGDANLDDVVIDLFNEFGLKESTVRAYAASPAFVIGNGRIRFRRSDEEVMVNDRIASASGLYLRSDGSVVYHLTVDVDVLRGSGRSIPSPLSVALGVRPGDDRSFLAGGTQVRVSWLTTSTTGAAIGSTRSVAEALGAVVGDVVRLVFDLGAGKVEASVVSGSSLSELTGLVLTNGCEAAEIADAIRVDPLEVRAALADRGDSDVASLIPVTQASSRLDDALSRLHGLLG